MGDSIDDAEQPLLQGLAASADGPSNDAATGSTRQQTQPVLRGAPAGRAEEVGRAASSALLVALLVGGLEGGLLLAARCPASVPASS